MDLIGRHRTINEEISHLPYQKKDTFSLLKVYCRLVKAHGKYPVSTDDLTWYPQACELSPKHNTSTSEKSIIQMKDQFVKVDALAVLDKAKCNHRHFKILLTYLKMLKVLEILNQP